MHRLSRALLLLLVVHTTRVWADQPIDANPLEPVAALLSVGRFDEALQRLDALPKIVGNDEDAQHARVSIGFLRTTALLYERKVDAATRVFEQCILEARASHDVALEAWMHNALTWVRWTAGDHPGALAQNEQVRAVLAPLPAKEQHELLLHYWWDRAYLLDEDPTTHAAASAAQRKYGQIADRRKQHDGVAVLAAFFAVQAGDGKAALRAARRVDQANDDDVQDLYVLMLAHEAGGDHAGAESILAHIRNAHEYPMKPIILSRIETDRGSTKGR